MELGNRAAAQETLQELENALQNCYIVGNADMWQVAQELRAALEEAE